MSGQGTRVSPYRVEWIKLAVEKPVLYGKDRAEITRKYGTYVKAKVDKYKGENGWETRKRLQMKVPYDCNEKVLREATIRALGLIHGNSICGGPTPDDGPLEV